MAGNFGEGLKDIFLAGVGAMAITGEKSKEIVDKLIAKGELSVEQGKEINQELSRKANDTVGKVRTEALSQFIDTLSEEERKDFSEQVAKLVQEKSSASEKSEEQE